MQKLIQRQTKVQIGQAMASGFLLAVSFFFENLWPLIFIALVPFLLSVARGSVRRVAFLAMISGVIHFTALLYWIVFVLGRYGQLPLVVAVGAVVLLALYMSLYVLLFGVAARQLVQKSSSLTVLFVLPATWVGLDWLRGQFTTAFPWMDPGYLLASKPWLIQSCDMWGHYGLTYIIIMVNVMAALLLIRQGKGKAVIVAPVLLLFLIIAGYSWLRWPQVEQIMQGSPSIHVGVTQGNIDQGVKWSPEMGQKTVTTYLDESSRIAAAGQLDLLVWPETALPFYPTVSPLMNQVLDFVSSVKVELLTGAPWFDLEEPGTDKLRYYNSALLLNTKGQLTGISFKSQLVPFGEYVPFKRFLGFLEPLVEAVGNFTRGRIDKPLSCKNGHIGVLICYESIFPGISRQWVLAGADLLVNVTNDSWYGRSTAPHQSFAMTIIRSVETRRSLVRAANTGISGFVDPLGRVVQRSPLFQLWSGTGDVVLMKEQTFFVRFGYLFGPICLSVALLFVGFTVVMRNR